MIGSTQLIFGTEEALEHENFNRDSGWNTQKEPVLKSPMGLETWFNFLGP